MSLSPDVGTQDGVESEQHLEQARDVHGAAYGTAPTIWKLAPSFSRRIQ